MTAEAFRGLVTGVALAPCATRAEAVSRPENPVPAPGEQATDWPGLISVGVIVVIGVALASRTFRRNGGGGCAGCASRPSCPSTRKPAQRP
jgi:hypothetical protein